MKTLHKIVLKIAYAWHTKRALKLARKLEVKTAECSMLRVSERDYRDSYYGDLHRWAVCERIEIESKKKYHEDRAALLQPIATTNHHPL